MGGAFVVGALGFLILYGFLFNGFAGRGLLTGTLWGTALIFTAGVAGKLTGIGIARLRLCLLYRYLRMKYQTKGD
jgi:hypothetical protein